MKKILSLLLLISSLTSLGGTIVVTNTNDTGTGSLRNAVTSAVGGDTIRFDASLISSGSDTIVLASEISIDKELTVIGIYNSSDTLFISGNNTVRIFNINLNPATVKNIIIDSLLLVNGSGYFGGGAIRCSNTENLIIKNSIISNNEATGPFGPSDGGAIYSNAFNLTIDQSIFRYNDGRKGGGIYASINCYVNIKNSLFEGNTASNNGAAIFLDDGGVINNVIIKKNHSIGGGGGITLFSSSDTVSIINSLIDSNIAEASGGGIDNNSFTSIINTTISNNECASNNGFSKSGGGILNARELNIIKSTINDNKVINGEGGGIHSYGKLVLNNLTITNNSSDISGGGIFNTQLVEITNSTIVNNTAPLGGGIRSDGASASQLHIAGSIIAENGPSNISNRNSQQIYSLGYNAISESTISGSVSSDYLGVNALQLKLGTLKDNGGSTFTLSPEFGSIAINNGNPIDLTEAQNDTIYNDIREIGSAEYRNITLQQALIGCDSVLVNGFYMSSDSVFITKTGTNNMGIDTIYETVVTINNSFNDSLFMQGCDSISFNGISYYNSIIFSDTLATSYNCDSILTYAFTVFKSSYDTITDTACEMYTSSGNNIYNISGVYNDTLTNVNGCDSIIILYLTINNNTFDTITDTVCDSYLSPGGKTFTATGVYFDTITNELGCDSLMTINLTVYPTYNDSIYVQNCDSVLFNGITYYNSQIVYDSLVSSSNCDSITNYIITIFHPTFDTVSEIACDTYLSPSGKTLATSGIYSDTLQNIVGCDSIISINLTVYSSYKDTIYDSVCSQYVSPLGNVYTTTGVYIDTLSSINMCDSIIVSDVVVTTIDTSTLVNGLTITSNYFNASYQWFNCDLNTTISGETSQVFTATANGNYAVIISNNNCVDTSGCVSITSVGLDENINNISLNLYPNPASNFITLDVSGASSYLFAVTDLLNRTVINQKTTTNNKQNLNIGNLKAGVYFMHVYVGANKVTKKFVVE